MSVSLSVRHVIKYDDTDRDWVVPSSLVHEDDKGQKWLQLRSSNYGLCLLLGCSHASRNPSLKGAEGLTYVIEQRNKLLGLLPEEDKLFGGEAAPADQPKKKRRQVHNNIEVEHVDIQLPEDFGTIVVRAADKVTSDLQVLLEEASLHKLFGWMKHKRLAFDDPSRVYRKTGKYAKNRQALQRDDDDGDDDEIPEQNPIQDYNLVTSDEDS